MSAKREALEAARAAEPGAPAMRAWAAYTELDDRAPRAAADTVWAALHLVGSGDLATRRIRLEVVFASAQRHARASTVDVLGGVLREMEPAGRARVLRGVADDLDGLQGSWA